MYNTELYLRNFIRLPVILTEYAVAVLGIILSRSALTDAGIRFSCDWILSFSGILYHILRRL